MADSTPASKLTQEMKVALELRAKYENTSKRYFHPNAVVPHPANRGGDPMKELRLMSITSHLCANGADPVEANQNAKGTLLGQSAKDIEGGSEIAFYTGMDVTGGSLSHSHLNRLVAVPPGHEEYGTEYKTELYKETELDEDNGPDCTPTAGNDPRQELAPLTGKSGYEAPNMKCRRSRRIPRRRCNRMRKRY